jgi:type I restriction enzyme S subunit
MWSWVALSSVAELSGGLTKNSKRDSLPLQVPYRRVANVYANELRLDDVSVIGCTENEVTRTTLTAGDLLLVEGNGSLDQIGREALWGGELEQGVHQNHLMPCGGLDSKFALYWLLSPLGPRAIEAVAASSSGLHTLSLSKGGSLPLPPCSLEEQHEIVRRIDFAFARIDRLAKEAKRALELVGRLDEAILAKAFRGELVPQDGNDEPAEHLLARIRADREAAPKGKRGRGAKG